MRRVVLGCALVLALAGLYQLRDWLHPVDQARALVDLDTLERHLAATYANLDWMATHRHVDLVALDRAARARMARALVVGQAQRAVREMVSAFHDPHVRVSRASARTGATGAPSEARDSPAATCEAGGYAEGNPAFDVPFPDAPGWNAYAESPFPAGRIGTVGVVRIGDFRETQYLDTCQQVGVGTDARDTQLRVRGGLQQALHGILTALTETGVTTVVVDVTGNGGGSEWAEDAARLFSAGPISRREPQRAAPVCDRTSIWRGQPVCPVLAPGGIETLQGLGAWRGAVLILADGRSASATEDFIVRLRESGVARLVGERTRGAGCGYVDGAPPVVLPHLGLEVRAPNCARFTSDGLNEVEGLPPDVAVPLATLDGREVVAAVLAEAAAQ